MEEAFARINFDVNEGNSGKGVIVSVVDAGILPNHRTISGRVIESSLTVTHDPFISEYLDWGTQDAIFVGGRIGSTVYGPAYDSIVEFVCCAGHEWSVSGATPFYGLGEGFRNAMDYLGETSESFVVNNSYAWFETVSYNNNDADKCRAIVNRNNAVCDEDMFSFAVPGTSLEAIDRAKLLAACVSPLEATERMCVFNAGDEGISSDGNIYHLGEQYFFEVDDILDSVLTPLNDVDRADLEDRVNGRAGILNLQKEDSRFSGHYIVATALKRDEDSLVTFTNGCGDAMLNCLSAPGEFNFFACDREPTEGICEYSDGYAESSDYAAPLVSGAAALLKSTYPNLSAPQVVSILLNSADDLGEPGPDNVFGMGKLNIMESLRPVGIKRSLTGESFGNSRIQLGSALDQSFSKSKATFGMFDVHDRAYLHKLSDVTSSLNSDASSSLDAFLASSKLLMDQDPSKRMGLRGTGSMRSHDSPDELSVQGLGLIQAGLEKCKGRCSSYRDVSAGSLVSSSSLVWMEKFTSADFGSYGLVAEAGTDESSNITYSSGGLAVATTFGESLLRVETGALEETGTFLGSKFGGAFDVGSGKGRYFSARLGTKIGDVAFGADYTAGFIRPHGATGSYISSVEAASFNGYRLAAGGNDWGLHYTVPLAATGGGMLIESVGGYTGPDGDWSVVDTNLGVAIDGSATAEDWSYRTDSHRIDFGAGKRERRLGLTLSEPRGAWDVLVALEHVSNSLRRAFAGNEVRAVVELSLFGD